MPSPLIVVDPGFQVPDYDTQLAAALAAMGHSVLLVTGPRLYGRSPENGAPDSATGPPAAATPGHLAEGEVGTWPAFGRLVAGDFAQQLGVAGRPGFRRALRAIGYGPEWLLVLRYLSALNPPTTIYLQWSLAPLIDASVVRTLRQWHHHVIYTAHNILPHEPRPWQPALLRQLYGAASEVVVQSVAGRRALIRLMAGDTDIWSTVDPADGGRRPDPSGIGRRTTVITMPADGVSAVPSRAQARQQLGLANDARVVLFFGHIRPYKGLDVLLEAWPLIREQSATAVLLIAGQVAGGAAARRRLEGRVRRHSTDNSIDLRPDYVPLRDKAAYFAAADLVTLPYRGPAESAVLAAARGHGRATVGSRVPGLEEALMAGGGLLVPPEDPAALAAAILNVIVDLRLQERLEAEARAVASGWTWADAARQYASLATEA